MFQALNLRQRSSNQVCDYSDAYILVTGDKTATNGNRNTNIAFENCATAQLYKMCNSYK